MEMVLIKMKLVMKMAGRMMREVRRAKVREVAGKWSRQQTTAPMHCTSSPLLYFLFSTLYQFSTPCTQ